MTNNTPLNILISYAYLKGSVAFIDTLKRLSLNGSVNLMLDSGAFTKFNAKGNFQHINVSEYCDFLGHYADIFEKYVMLDVIGNAEASKKNYEYMLSRGLNPMFVVTMFDNDIDYIKSAVKRNANICVAGGATTKGDWLVKRYQDIYASTGRKALIHGLAYVTYPKMLQLPLASVDSSSWKAASLRFGQLQYFDNGLKSFHYKDVYKHGGKALLPVHRTLLKECGITPAIYAREENHKGNYSIESMYGIRAALKMQRVCYRSGLRYFLAISNMADLEKIMYVHKNYNNLDYNKFKDLK